MPTLIPCLSCGRPTAKHRSGRCPTCRAPIIASYRRSKGYDRSEIRATMAAVVKRDGCCRRCGARGVTLTAHFIPGGPHSTNVADYVALCRQCHGHVDGGKRPAAA